MKIQMVHTTSKCSFEVAIFSRNATKELIHSNIITNAVHIINKEILFLRSVKYICLGKISRH